MPKNKTNKVSRATCDDPIVNEDSSLELGFTQQDLRSKEEKVSDLTDLFIGDYHIDTDIIHSVLEECGWNVEKATAKLFEVFFAGKASEDKAPKEEQNDLATIAVSLLGDEDRSFSERCSNSEREDSLVGIDFSVLSISADVNNSLSAINIKGNNNSRPKVPSNENLVQYDYSSQKLDTNESKTFFESKSGPHDFYNKSSFGDMAHNMEHYDNSRPRTSDQNSLHMGENHQENNHNLRVSYPSQKVKLRFDAKRESAIDPLPLNRVENSSIVLKNNSSTSYVEKSMESLFTSSSSITSEWNKFYKQLNLQPLQNEKTSPEINLAEFLDYHSPTVSENKIKTSISIPDKISHENVQGHVSSHKSDTALNNKLRFQVPKQSSTIGSEIALSHESDEIHNDIGKENHSRQTQDQQTTLNNSLSALAPDFVPRCIDTKQPMSKKPTTKHAKFASAATPLTRDYTHLSLEDESISNYNKDKEVMHNMSSTSSKKNTRNKNLMHYSHGKHVQRVDPVDPLGWKEINAMTSSNTPKTKVQLNTKGILPRHNFDNKKMTESSSSKDNNTAIVPPFDYNIFNSNSGKKSPKKKKGKLPKLEYVDHTSSQSLFNFEDNNTSPYPSFSNWGENRLPATQESLTLGNSAHPFSLSHEPPTRKLPPSLCRNPNYDQFSSPLLQHCDSKRRTSTNHMIPKSEDIQQANTNTEIWSNRVKFVGVKTPLGKLKHYIDKGQHVIFILRGLPGSGKSYLAEQLVSECQQFNIQTATLSSDSYFMQSGHYNFNQQQLGDAHIWNQKKAQKCMKEKKHQLVIIDNTNTEMWEMMPYAEMAILNGYDIQVCEPDTQWKTKVPELVRCNQHGVGRDHIRRMKDRYQELTTDDVIREAAKSLKGKNKLPTVTSKHPISVTSLRDKPQPSQMHEFQSNSQNTTIPSSYPKSSPTTSNNPNTSLHPKSTDDKTQPPLLDPTLMQWMPAMEQRMPGKKSKKSAAQVDNRPQSQEITLNFLNNSLKKALVGIEKWQKESSSMSEGDKHREKKAEHENEMSIDRSETNIQNMAVGGDGNGTLSAESTVQIEKEGDESVENLSKNKNAGYVNKCSSLTNRKEEKTQSNNTASLEASNNFPKLDLSGSTGDSFYSCGSDVNADGTDQRELHFDDCEDIDEYLTKTENILKEEREQHQIPEVKTYDEKSALANLHERESSSETSTVVIEKEGIPPSTASTCLIDDQEHSVTSKCSLTKAPGGHIKNVKCSLSVKIPTDKGADFIRVDKDFQAVEAASEEQNGKDTKSETGKKCVEKIEITHHLPSPSLVMYSDSEDEEAETCVKDSVKELQARLHEMSLVVDSEIQSSNFNSNEEITEGIDNTGNEGQLVEKESLRECEVNDKDTSCSLSGVSGIDESHGESDKVLAQAVSEINLCGTAVSIPDGNDNVCTAVSEIKEMSPKSNSSSTREQSPALDNNDSSVPEDSPSKKKKKKKKVQPDVTQGPFIEESLKEKSKTENWSSFFFNNSPTPERQLSPTKAASPVTTKDSWSQCEPYYFSMVYRLNSAAFSNQQPVDISNCDVVMLQASDGHLWEERSSVVQRKFETTDRSTNTDETLVSDEVDLDTLQNCFPVYSRKQLEDVMSVCQNNLEWVSLHLLECPPLLGVGDDDDDDDEEEEEKESNKSGSKQKSFESKQEEKISHVKSLAQLCQDVIQNEQQVFDSDDFEDQIIQAGQTRLQEIEIFARSRIHSYSRETSHISTMSGIGSWAEEIISLENFHGISGPSTYGNDAFQTDTSFFRPKCISNVGDSQLPQAFTLRKGQEFPDTALDTKEMYTTSPVPVLPISFIQSLEKSYGAFNADLMEPGLLLDDSTARKIYNCLKLQLSKKQVQTHHYQQIQEDEAMAKALQEEENAAGQSAASQNSSSSSVAGWTRQTPSWMKSAANNIPKQQQHDSNVNKPKGNYRNPSFVNSVSDTLHNLRGGWPKRLKPFKFHSKMPRSNDYSVWTLKSTNKHRPDNMQSIMQEEKDREARLKQMLVVSQATGNVDALATKIKRTKLTHMFPFMSPDMLEEVFMNHGYSLEDTVEALECQYEIKPVAVPAAIDTVGFNDVFNQNQRASSIGDIFPNLPKDDDTITHDDYRKEAQFYNNLAIECRQKAQKHHGEGMHHAAFFYRQEVKKYLAKKEEANENAAMVIFNKGSERLLRENTLDLHSYHINEAIEAVNLALEMKLSEYHRQSDRKRAYLTIITGRGRNSRWGIPKLKPAIISHLSNKGLRFEETAPGMFKVHIFQDG